MLSFKKKDKYDIEKFKALYEFQLKGLEHVIALHGKHEDKAAKYLTVSSIVITALTIFTKQYLFDSTGCTQGLIYKLVVAFILSIFICLFLIAKDLFEVMSVSEVGKLENTPAMIEFFNQNDRPVIYYNLSIDINDIIKRYENANYLKVQNLKKAFKKIKWCGVLFIFTVVLIIIDTSI